MQNIFKSVSDVINDRIKDAFAGTFILVIILSHWKIPYMIFEFDKDCTLEEKISKIEHYLHTQDVYTLLWHPVGYTLLIILFYLLFSTIALFFKVVYEKWLRPLVFLIDKNKLATKEDLDFAKVRNRDLENELSDLEKKNSDLRDANKSLVDSNYDLSNEKAKLENEKNSILGKAEDYDKVDKERGILIEEVTKLKQRSDLQGLFDGSWRLDFRSKTSGLNGDEDVLIKANSYYANGKYKFAIDMVEIGPSNIRFRKTGIHDTDRRVIICDLSRSTDNYAGTEVVVGTGEVINVEYNRVSGFRQSTLNELNKSDEV